MRWQFVALSIVALGCVGCYASPSTLPPEPESVPDQQEPMPLDAPAADEPAGDTEMVRKKAEAGVGAKGEDLKFELGTTAAKAYFLARERVAFDIQIPKSMQLYDALHNRAPATHDEFMKEIIKANAIKLPELPANHRYVYDPEKAELLIEHPK